MAENQPHQPTNRPHRILIVDDHPIVRHGLTELIARQSDLEVCGDASNSADALRQIEADPPDLAIIDISLEGENGLELIKQIKSRWPQVRMLVSSMHDETVYAPRAFQAGAQGYLSKQESIRKMIDAVRQILRDEVYLTPRMANRLLRNLAHGESLERNPMDSLTNRELQVFELVGQGHNTPQIARMLEMSPRTVETHRKHIKKKLGLANSMELNRAAFLWVQGNR
jgi:DNA-binding NarL/FixJ family response regulator